MSITIAGRTLKPTSRRIEPGGGASRTGYKVTIDDAIYAIQPYESDKFIVWREGEDWREVRDTLEGAVNVINVVERERQRRIPANIEIGEARADEINNQLVSWLEQGIDIQLYAPDKDDAHYVAVVEEFGLIGEGDSLDEATDNVFTALLAFIESFIGKGQPLPHRKPRTDSADAPVDSGDER
jgi:predicted RNase H-like HicB family nuclease